MPRAASRGYVTSKCQSRVKAVRAREGRFLLRSNLTETDPAQLWEFYLQIVEVEAGVTEFLCVRLGRLFHGGARVAHATHTSGRRGGKVDGEASYACGRVKRSW